VGEYYRDALSDTNYGTVN